MEENPKIKIQKQFVNQNGSYSVSKLVEGTLLPSMPPAIYSIKFNELLGRYEAEKQADKVKLPTKLFSTGYENITSKIIDNYLQIDKASGAIFSGPAGVGKSITAQRIQNFFIEDLNLPVYLISNSFVGQEFMDFVNDLGDGLFIFDEFEKQYKDKETQEKLLSLFDGSDSKVKRLSLLIVNDYYALSKYYKDRTGRNRYSVTWETLPISFIKEYLESELKATNKYNNIVEWVENQVLVTFDNLEALTCECNRYQDSKFEDVIEYLNIPKEELTRYFEVVSVSIGDTAVSEDRYDRYIMGKNDVSLYIKDDEEYEEHYNIYLHDLLMSFSSPILTSKRGNYTIKLLEIDKETYKERLKHETN